MTIDSPENFGANVLDYLKVRNMTQQELAKKSGMTKAAMNLIIRGKRTPGLITACKISEALGLPLHNLIR